MVIISIYTLFTRPAMLRLEVNITPAKKTINHTTVNSIILRIICLVINRVMDKAIYWIDLRRNNCNADIIRWMMS